MFAPDPGAPLQSAASMAHAPWCDSGGRRHLSIQARKRCIAFLDFMPEGQETRARNREDLATLDFSFPYRDIRTRYGSGMAAERF